MYQFEPEVIKTSSPGKRTSFRSSHLQMFLKIAVSKKVVNYTGKPLYWSLFLITLQLWGPETLLKKTQTDALPFETCKIFKNIYFEEHLWTTASKLSLKRNSNTGVFLRICELFKNIYLVEYLQTTGSQMLVRGSLFNKVASLMAWSL